MSSQRFYDVLVKILSKKALASPLRPYGAKTSHANCTRAAIPTRHVPGNFLLALAGAINFRVRGSRPSFQAGEPILEHSPGDK